MARRVFAPEFRRSAVSLVVEQNYSMKDAAGRLGVNVGTLEYWVKQHRKRNGTVSVTEEKDKGSVLGLQREHRCLGPRVGSAFRFT